VRVNASSRRRVPSVERQGKPASRKPCKAGVQLGKSREWKLPIDKLSIGATFPDAANLARSRRVGRRHVGPGAADSRMKSGKMQSSKMESWHDHRNECWSPQGRGCGQKIRSLRASLRAAARAAFPLGQPKARPISSCEPPRHPLHPAHAGILQIHDAHRMLCSRQTSHWYTISTH
jgi:hypothetical protein